MISQTDEDDQRGRGRHREGLRGRRLALSGHHSAAAAGAAGGALPAVGAHQVGRGSLPFDRPRDPLGHQAPLDAPGVRQRPGQRRRLRQEGPRAISMHIHPKVKKRYKLNIRKSVRADLVYMSFREDSGKD